jgi:hypothetical protein
MNVITSTLLGLVTVHGLFHKFAPNIAHELMSAAANVYFAYHGIVYQMSLSSTNPWLESDPVMQSVLIAPFVGYQLWNTIICASRPEPEKMIRLAHHACAVGAGAVGMMGIGHGYAPFLLGVTAMSTLPMCALQMIRHVHVHCCIKLVIEASLVTLFVPIRCVLYPIVAYKVMCTLPDLSGHLNPHTIITIAIANIFMASLQLWWGLKIAIKISKRLKARH